MTGHPVVNHHSHVGITRENAEILEQVALLGAPAPPTIQRMHMIRRSSGRSRTVVPSWNQGVSIRRTASARTRHRCLFIASRYRGFDSPSSARTSICCRRSWLGDMKYLLPLRNIVPEQQLHLLAFPTGERVWLRPEFIPRYIQSRRDRSCV
jgi:hypothetical protein